MPISPGSYIEKRREAVFLSIEDVAAQLPTENRDPLHLRAEHLRLIEKDIAPASFKTIVAIATVVPLDMEVLVALSVDDPHRPVPAMCPACGCSAKAPCVDQVKLVTCARKPGEVCSACAVAGRIAA